MTQKGQSGTHTPGKQNGSSASSVPMAPSDEGTGSRLHETGREKNSRESEWKSTDSAQQGMGDNRICASLIGFPCQGSWLAEGWTEGETTRAKGGIISQSSLEASFLNGVFWLCIADCCIRDRQSVPYVTQNCDALLGKIGSKYIKKPKNHETILDNIL